MCGRTALGQGDPRMSPSRSQDLTVQGGQAGKIKVVASVESDDGT